MNDERKAWLAEAERLAMQFAHCYAFVGDDTMPKAKAALMEHLARASLPQPAEPAAAQGEPSKHPDFYTWTWDVWVSGGNWRAEYGWEPPSNASKRGRIVRNVRPLFKHPAASLPPARLSDSEIRTRLGPLLNAFGELHWCSGRGHDVSHERIAEAFEAILAAASAPKEQRQ
jgi:hypothetical protein